VGAKVSGLFNLGGVEHEEGMDIVGDIYCSSDFRGVDSASGGYQLLGLPKVVWEKERTRLSDLLRPILSSRTKKCMQVRVLRTMNFTGGTRFGEKSSIGVNHCWLLFVSCFFDVERLR